MNRMQKLNDITCFQTDVQGLPGLSVTERTVTLHLHIADLFSSCFQGVQSQKCASFVAAMEAGQPFKVAFDDTTTLTDCKLNKRLQLSM